jgi:CubicO group peptidase (beta-lactamase class C family)
MVYVFWYMTKKLACTAMFAVLMATTTAASPVSASSLKTCKQILAKYPNGVARDKVGVAAVVSLGFAAPTIQRKVYDAAKKLDRFKDNTVCVTEANKRALFPGLPAPAITSTNDPTANGHPAVSDALYKAVADHGGTCVVAMRDGKIIGEWYSGGRSPTTKTIGMSTSKPLTAAVIGAAERLGRLKIDQPVSDFVPELKGTAKAGITIRHMLTHTSGLLSSSAEAARTMTYGAGSMTAAALTLPLVNTPGSFYRYETSSISLQLLMLVVERAVGEKFATFADKYVLRPAGMANSVYKGDEPATNWDTGDPWLAGGLNTTCRDLARLGQLFHAKGTWAGQQLFSADFATQATSVQVPQVNNGGLVMDYGFLNNIVFGGVGHLGACGGYLNTRPSGVTLAALSDTTMRTSTETPEACAPMRVGLMMTAVRAMHDKL